MLIQVLKSKIAYATVTRRELFYVGSVTIDSNIMAQAGIIANERVQVVNLNNGERLETYVIAGEPGSGVFAMNGPAARRCEIGDQIFILAYAYATQDELPIEPVIVDLKS